MRETEDAPVIPLDTGPSPASGEEDKRSALVAGMEVARRLEASTDLAQRARRHAKRGGKSDVRRRARRQLKKLIAALRETQATVLSNGVTAAVRADREEALDTLDDKLRWFLGREPKKKVLQQVELAAKLARKSL